MIVIVESRIVVVEVSYGYYNSTNTWVFVIDMMILFFSELILGVRRACR